TVDGLLNWLRQYIHLRWLPAGIHIDRHLIGFVTLCRREVDIDRLIKPGGLERLTFQITVHKAELPTQVFQRALQRLNVETVITEVNIAFGGSHLPVQRDIKM